MFEVPESDIISVRIDEDVITGKKPIEYVRRAKRDESANKSDAGGEEANDKSSTSELDTEPKSKAQTYA
jgi:hypothetical protein